MSQVPALTPHLQKIVDAEYPRVFPTRVIVGPLKYC